MVDQVLTPENTLALKQLVFDHVRTLLGDGMIDGCNIFPIIPNARCNSHTRQQKSADCTLRPQVGEPIIRDRRERHTQTH